jgi:hypothetical protein
MIGTAQPLTVFSDSTLKRLVALEPKALAVMHGSSFCGDGRNAILDLEVVVNEILSNPERDS